MRPAKNLLQEGVHNSSGELIVVDDEHAELGVEFQAFPVGELASLVSDRLKVAKIDLSTEKLMLDGESHIKRDAQGWHADAREMTLEGLPLADAAQGALRPASSVTSARGSQSAPSDPRT